MFKNKTLYLILAVIIAAIAVSNDAEASYLGRYYGSGESMFNSRDSHNEFSNSFNNYDFSNRDSRSQFSNNNYEYGLNGHTNSNYGSFNQNGYVSMSDGYSFTKKPCSTRTVTGNGHGRYHDYTVKEKICDGISGTFYKDNGYVNNVNNQQGYNQNDYSTNVLQNSQNSESSLSEQNIVSNWNNGYSYGESTTFGVGTRILFY